MSDAERITTLLPAAPGWRHVSWGLNASEDDVELYFDHVLMWAAVNYSDGECEVVPVILDEGALRPLTRATAGVVLADPLGLSAPEANTESFLEQARRHWSYQRYSKSLDHLSALCGEPVELLRKPGTLTRIAREKLGIQIETPCNSREAFFAALEGCEGPLADALRAVANEKA